MGELRHELLIELRALESQLRHDMDRRLSHEKKAADCEREMSHSLLKELITEQASSLQKVQHEKTTQDLHHGSIRSRLDNFENGLAVQLSKRVSAVESNMRDLREIVTGERLAREQHHGTVQEVIKKHLAEDGAARDLKHCSLEDSFERLAGEKRKLHERHASIEERVKFLEATVGDSADKHNREIEAAHSKIKESSEKHRQDLEAAQAKLQAAHARLDQLHAHVSQTSHSQLMVSEASAAATLEDRLTRLEQHCCSSESRLSSSLESQMASVKDRVQYLEGVIGDSADKHSKALEAAHGKIRESAERHSQELEVAQANLQAAHARLDQLHAHVSQQQLRSAEVSVSASIEQRLARAEQSLEMTESRLNVSVDGQLASLKERIISLEGLVNNPTEKNEKSELQDRHATLKDRVDFMEHLLGASADKHEKHALGLEGLRAKIEQSLGRISALERHARELEEYHRACAVFTPEEKAGLDARLQMLGSNSDRRAKDVEMLKSSHARVATELEGFKTEHHASTHDLAKAKDKLEELHGRVTTCEVQSKKNSDGHVNMKSQSEAQEKVHATLAERLDYLEAMLGDSADRHGKELEALKAAHARHAKDVQGAKAAQAHHASMAERFEYLEGALREASEKTDRALLAAAGRIDELQGRLAAQSSDVGRGSASRVGFSSASEAQLTPLRARLDRLEGALHESLGAHGAHLEDLKVSHAKLASLTAAHSDRLASLNSSQERAGREGPALEESLTKGPNALEAVAVASTTTIAVEQHANEIQQLRVAHAKHERDTKSAQAAHHATLTERIDYVEGMLHESLCKHNVEVSAAITKCDQLHSRVSVCEAQHGALGDLRKSHATLISKKAALEESHTALKDRVDGLESMVNDFTEKHFTEVSAVKAAHRKLAVEAKAHQGKVVEQLTQDRGERDAHHTSVHERFLSIERAHGDAVERHTKALDAHKVAHTKLADETRAQKECHATLEQRLDIIELALGITSNGCTDLDASRTSPAGKRLVGALGPHIAHDRTISLVSRVSFLEGLMGTSAETTSQDMRGATPLVRRLEQLEKLVSNVKASQTRMEGVEDRLNVVKEAWGSAGHHW